MTSPRLTLVRPPVALPDAAALDGLDAAALVAIAERAAALHAGAMARLALRVTPRPTPATPAALVDGHGAAQIIGVPKSWLAAEARRGTFRSYKRGHYRRYDPREVVEDFKRLHGADV